MVVDLCVGQYVIYETLNLSRGTINFMDRKFEAYIGGPTIDPTVRLHVTLAPNGRLFINKRVYQMLGKPDAVRLYYAREDAQIGVEPAAASLPEAMPVFQNKQGYRVNAAPFCRHFGIRLTQTEKFLDPHVESQTLILNLRRTVILTGSTKGRTKKKPSA